MDRPNILLMMADQLSVAALPAYGHELDNSASVKQVGAAEAANRLDVAYEARDPRLVTA